MILVVIVALIAFLIFWQRRNEGMGVTEEEDVPYDDHEMEEITADLDELREIEPPEEFVERVPDADALAAEVEVELEEKSI